MRMMKCGSIKILIHLQTGDVVGETSSAWQWKWKAEEDAKV